MADVERIREVLSQFPTPEYLKSKTDQGWRPIAIEWERAPSAAQGPARPLKHEVPYGLKVSEDCRHLEEDPNEKAILKLMLALIAGDHPLSKIAGELNRQGSRMRDGAEWTQVALFNLLPRLIEVAPDIVSTGEWSANRNRILRTV